MSVSIYIDCGAGRLEESRLVCGQNAAREHWLPLIESLSLDLLDVAFSGGLGIGEEYYSGMLDQVTTLLAKFTEKFGSSLDLADVIPRCTMLRDTLLEFPPGSGCELYLG
jgi:hypothetical protein